MKHKIKPYIITACISVIVTTVILLGALYGFQLLPKGTRFSFDTLGVFLGSIGAVGAIFTILFTTSKQLRQQANISQEQNEIQKQNVNINEEQKEIQKQNVKLLLFDRRYQVYDRIVEFINSAISCSAFSVDHVNDFHNVNREAYMLFGNDIGDYIEELRQNGNTLASYIQHDIPGSNAASTHNDERLALQQWFTDQQTAVFGMFDKYLNVNNLGL